MELAGRSRVAKIEQLEDFEDEYVYDIGIDQETPYFFANNILVHNSSYFSAFEVLRDHPDWADFEWSKENIIALYDAIMEETNSSFPEFMMKTFNTSEKRGAMIKAGRELLGSTALFIKKKKYAIMMFEKEGERLDVDGKPGKMKVMGLDMKRSDTPKFMQKFLEEILKDILMGVGKDIMYQKVKDFRIAFKDRPAWEKGSPKKVSNFTDYSNEVSEAEALTIMSKKGTSKIRLPGHVSASINWNKLTQYYNDPYATRITDGTRIIVCALKKNVFNMKSIAYPSDEAHLPEWFKKLPFDNDAMENVIVDKKLTNLVGVLDWDLSKTINYDNDEFFIPKKKLS